jgi:hypothetical protein
MFDSTDPYEQIKKLYDLKYNSNNNNNNTNITNNNNVAFVPVTITIEDIILGAELNHTQTTKFKNMMKTEGLKPVHLVTLFRADRSGFTKTIKDDYEEIDASIALKLSTYFYQQNF